MKNKKLIILIAIFLISIVFFILRKSEVSETIGSVVTTVQYQAKDIREIDIIPLETYGVKEVKINNNREVEEFCNFINSLRYKKLREGGLIGGETPQIMIHVLYINGTCENLDIHHAGSRGLINEIIGDSYLQIGYDRNPYKCTNCTYEEFEAYINKLNKWGCCKTNISS